jgi:hypothetical protein
MKQIAEQLQEIVIKEGKKNSTDKQLKEFNQLLDEMKKSGYIKTPNYTLPLVDTIGKTYYSSINKRD